MFATRTLVSVLLVAAFILPASAQRMVQTSSPFQSIGSDSFHGSSIDWTLRGPNWFANFGGQGPLLPPFGGGDPGAGLSGGFGFGGGGVSGSLGFNFAQGSTQSISSTTPSVTTMDGSPGSISSTVIRPFVTGFTPIVGDYRGAVAPLRGAAQASQRIGQNQYQAVRNSQNALHNKKLQQYLRRGQRAESEGNKRMARANYRSAIALATEPLRSQISAHLKAMMKRESPKQ